MAKRSLDEFDDVSAVSRPSLNAKVEGVFSAVSLMKKSRTCLFFDGKITDGKTSMRVWV